MKCTEQVKLLAFRRRCASVPYREELAHQATVRFEILPGFQARVMRMLAGESVDSLSRELGVEPYRLERLRDRALSGMESGLKEREGDPASLELDRANKKIGELSMEIELLRKRCEARESLRRRRSR